MWHFVLRQTGRFGLGLFGAVVLSACISALSAAGRIGHSATFGDTFPARLVSIYRLDFGVSIVSMRPAWVELAHSLPITLELVGLGGLIAFLAGVPIGALLHGSRARWVGTPLIQIASALPVFCICLVLLWVSQRVLGLTGAVRPESLFAAVANGNMDEIEAAARAVFLPALAVGAAGAVDVQLVLQRVIGRTANEPYRKGLRAMGLGRFEIDRLYLLPQVAAGLLHHLREIALSLLAAAVVVERVFNWPGAADLFLKSVALEDWAVAGLVLLSFAALAMAAEFAGSLLARLLAETEAAQ